MRILARADIQRALSMRDAITIVRDAFAQLSAHQATVPVRVPIPIQSHDGITLFMPAHLHTSDALAVKIVSVHNQNPAKGLPLIHALVVVIDATTGKPLAAMEGGYLTALRTGAGSGVATDLLARREAKVAAIFGAGAQGRTQLLAIAAVRQLERVYVYDALPSQVEKFIAEIRGQSNVPNDIRAASSSTEAVRDADIICTATTATRPVFDGKDIKPGAHINAIGAYTPAMREVDETTLRHASKIVIDHRASALAKAGDLLIARNCSGCHCEERFLRRSNLSKYFERLLRSARNDKWLSSYHCAEERRNQRIGYLRGDWGNCGGTKTRT